MVQECKQFAQTRRYRVDGRWQWGRLLFLLGSLLAVTGLGVAQLPSTPTTFPGTTAVGTSSGPTATVTLTALPAGGTVAEIAVTTSGIANTNTTDLDFIETSGGTCSNGTSLAAGQTCTVNITFAPRFPGIRQGAVLLETSGGQLLAETPLSGIGGGGLPVLVPATINTVAGDAQWIYQQDNVPATQTSIFLPTGLAVDASGGLYLCDSRNNRVRYVDPKGVIHTVAGGDTSGSAGDGYPANLAELNDPSGLALDGAGNLYIADTGNNSIRKVDAVSGVITTVPGTSGVLNAPEGLALTPAGDLVIADTGNNVVRELTVSTGQMRTIAGVAGPANYGGDGGPATQAQLSTPFGVAVRSDGAIAIADRDNNVVRLVDLSGNISTIAGDGQGTFGGDSGPATQAQLYSPTSVAFDPAGDLFIADSGNNRVRGVFGTPGNIVTLAGNSGQQFTGDGGPDDQASLYGPYVLVFDASGNIWVSDMFHNRVREIYGSSLGITYPPMKVGKVSTPLTGTLYNGGNTNLTLGNPTLVQAQLDPGTTTCNQTPMAPMAFCNMGIDFAPTEVNANDTGSVSWISDAPNVTPVDALNGEVLSVEPTSIAIVSAENPGLLGQPVILSATVTSAGTGLTGTVTFTEGNNTLCSAVNLASNGAAICNIPSLSLGTHSIVASYSGDSDDAASTSAPFAELIKQAPALALAVSSSPAVVTSNVTLTLTAADQSGTPTGTVIFYDGPTALATLTLNSAGVAQWSTQTFTVGTHQLSAQYSGDSANAAGSSNTVVEQIAQANTVTVLASNSSNPILGTALTLTATVVSNVGPAPTGSVQFTDGSGAGASVLGSATLSATGTASITVTTLAPGAHSIVASYGGDTDDAGSNSAVLPENVQTSGITLVSNNNPAVSGQTVAFTAQLNTVGPVPPTGVAIFRDNGTMLGSASFNSAATVTFATNALSVGAHTITVTYTGDSSNAPAGGQLTQTVIDATTAVTLTASASPAIYGQPLNLTAVVTSNGGIATGTVNFLDGGTTVGSAQLNGSGVAVLTIANLTPGANSLVASYAGDGKASPSASAPLAIVVKQSTTLAVSSNSDPAQTLSAIILTATVTNAGAAPATGSVSFTDGGTAIGTAQLNGAGQATLTLPEMSAGSHSIAASYPGDGANFGSASGIFNQTVQLRPTATTVTASSTDPSNPQQITLIAVVKGQGSAPPSGTVSFTRGSLTLGQATVDDTGVATITVIFQQTSQPVVASYTGDVNYLASLSTATTITAGQPAQFTLAVNVPNVTLVTHQHTTLNVDIGSVKGFTDSIALGCLGLPYAATCTFTPSQVNLAPNGTVTASLILDTGDPLGAGSGTTASWRTGSSTLLCCLPAGLLLALLRRREQSAKQRRLGTLLLLLIGLAVSMTASGCGGLSTNGTPPGTYSFRVVGTGQGSTTTQAETVTLVVTQ